MPPHHPPPPVFALILPSHHSLTAAWCIDDRFEARACMQLTSEAESNPKTGLKVLLIDPRVSD